MVVIVEAEDVAGACLSAQVLKNNSSLPIVAFVDVTIMHKFNEELHQVFDEVTAAPPDETLLQAASVNRRDMFLLQILKMRTFSSVIVIQPGVLVFHSFEKILEEIKLVENGQEEWKVVGLQSNRKKFDEAVQILQDGGTFDIGLINAEITDSQHFASKKAISWSDLEYYTGEEIPFVDLNRDITVSQLSQMANEESTSYWKNVILRKLKLAIQSEFPTVDENSWIAIVGMGCRFPKANSVDEFWQVLTSGENTSSAPPSNRVEFSSDLRANFLSYVHMILQESPQIELDPQHNATKPGLHILALSAKTNAALDQLSEAFASFLGMETNEEKSLNDIAYTTNACRPHHPFRKSVFGRNKEELILQLNKSSSVPMKERKTDFVVGFIVHDQVTPSQLSNYRALYSTFPVFKMQMDFCDTLCQRVTSFSPLSCLLNNNIITNSEIPNSILSTKEWQFCSLSLTFSLYKLWESWGVKGSYVLGINFSNKIIKIESVASGSHETNLKQIFNFILNNTAPNELTSSPQLQPRVGFVSCVNGEERSCSNPSAALSELTTHGCNVFIEVGVEKIFGIWDDSIIPSSESKPLLLPAGVELLDGSLEGNGLRTIYSTLSTLYNAGYPIDWEGFYKYNSCTKVSLPHYPFQRKSIWFKGGKREEVPTQVIPRQIEFQLLHPLLGNYVSSPSTTTTTAQAQQRVLFENLLIAQHQAPYLTDHVFGSDVIFPGAGFLELAVAATCFNNGTGPYIIENFQVHQPLHISKFEGCSIKTTVENGTKITVEAGQGGGDQVLSTVWKQHASAMGSSSRTTLELELIEPTMGSQHDVNGIKIRCTEDQHGPANFYTGIGKFGLSFGERFQTLQRIYKREGELLADVSIPPDAAHYICHPLLSDVMLQSYMILKNPSLEALHVPISILKFVCHRRVSPQECSSREGLNFHVYCDEKEDTVYLLDSQGRSVATMISPQIKATTVDAMLAAAGIQASRSNSAPDNDMSRAIDTYEVVWKPATSFQMEGSLKIPIDSTDFTKLPSYHNLLKSLEFRNKFTSGEKLIFENVNRLCELYILKALFDMGWKPHLGKSIRFDELTKEFNITEVFIPAFRHYLSYLVNQGVMVEQGVSIYTIKTLPEEKEVVEDSIEKLRTALSKYGPIHSLHCCGSQLASILQGRVKGQQLLFEEGESGLTPADQIYKTNLYYRSSANAAPQIFFEVARHLWNPTNTPMLPRKLRILEVGGGTGVFTSEALSILSEEFIDYTYYFTDISTSFLKKAEAKFPSQQANSNIIYKTFNIEKSPLEQGLPPAYFDIVVGLDVLHVTKELQNALANIHSVLKPGGHLIIGETCKPIPEVDLSFGIVDGYWQFKDHDIRPSHCTLSADGWLSLLQESGFAGPSSKALLANNHMCVVVGTKSHPEKTHEVNNAAISTKMWLLLHDLDDKPEIIEGIVKRMMNLGRSLVPCCISEGVQNLSPHLKGRTADFEGVLCMFEGKDSFASTNCRAILDPLLLVSKFLIEKGGSRRLCVATFGLSTACKDTVVGNPSSATALGFLRCVKLEVPSLISKLVDLDPNENEREKMLDVLVQELWIGDDETELSYRNGVRYNRRLIATSPDTTQDYMPIQPGVQNYSVALPPSNLLTDLVYLPKTVDVAEEQNQVVVERVWMGLQGMVVSWGQWNAGLAENLELETFFPFTEAQGLAALETFFIDNRKAAVAGFLKFKEIILRIPAYQKTFLKDLSLEKHAGVSSVESVCSDHKVSLPDAYFKSEEKEEKEKLVRNFVRERISETLGVQPIEVEEDVKFSSMGLDSLLSIEFYNKLQSEMGDVHLGYIDMEEQGTVNQISDLILTRLEECGK
ncbi:unnamed protein product [Orchesella dallaii]|uniref:Carrier domain-containing protein n=1 Tax=Orchesella dallaii TaxID=48710 RepID=A0ABP1Q123_9HEXA